MTTLNIRQALRNLRRNKVYTIINVAGLGIASAFIILVALYVRHGIIMDRFHAKSDQLYRIEMTSMYPQKETKKDSGFFARLAGTNNERNTLVMPVTLSGELKRNFPEVKDVVRIKQSWEPVIKIADRNFKLKGKDAVYVDNNFFTVFSFPLVQGTARSAFPSNNSVVITESLAKQLFGKEDPIGKTMALNIEENNLFTVSAVAKDFPSNSSFQFQLMLPVEGSSSYAGQLEAGTNTFSHLMVVELSPNVSVAAFTAKLNEFSKTFYKSLTDYIKQNVPEAPTPHISFILRPFHQAHFNGANPWFAYTDLKSTYQLITLALIALAIACVNYILLSMSQVASRTQEIGIRKTIGAKWKHILQLFLTETQILVLAAMLAGFLIAVTALPYFNSLTDVNIPIDELMKWDVSAIFFGLAVLLTLLAGTYPAIKMSGIRPFNMLRRFSTYKLSPSLSGIFVTVQYTACIVLIIFSIVIARQMNFMYQKDLGFSKENVLVVGNPYRFDYKKSIALRERILQYAKEQPGVNDITTTGFRFANGFNYNGNRINGKQEYVTEMSIDFNYFDFNKIDIIKGRAFSPYFTTDSMRILSPLNKADSLGASSATHVVVNETLYKMLGAPSLDVYNKEIRRVIVGVSKDYHFAGLEQKIGPAYHICRPYNAGFFWIRIAKNQPVNKLIDKLKANWVNIAGNEPFDFTFMDDDVRAVYESHQKWMKIISAASWLAIFIACLGLFGLSGIMAANRTKEIGIRKVLGADVTRLFLTLNKATFLIILLSIVIAIPLINYIAGEWLQNFEYRITLKWSLYVLGGLIGIVCAIIAISYNTIRAAMANPVKSLRND